MPFLIEHVTEVVFVLFILALLGNLLLIGTVFLRRQRRGRFFHRIDSLRVRYSPIIAGVLSGRIAYEKGLQDLQQISGSDRVFILEQLCLEKKPVPSEEPALRRLCEDLGLVKIWQQRLMGQVDQVSVREALMGPQGVVSRIEFLHFLVRSKSAENLGLIRHRPSWPLLVKALEDSNPDLQVVAARALAAIKHPGSFAALVERLQQVVLQSAPLVSVRTLKSALVSFPLENASKLMGSLQHANPRIRFLATDIIREMAEREAAGDPDFPLDGTKMAPELVEVFLTRLPLDENPDVRARSAPVIAYLADPRAAAALFTLLEDAVWFVRLHAARSLAKHRFVSCASKVACALTDPNWKVREAAVRALRGFGSSGLNLLTAHFLTSRDRYSREQIADEFQRAGLIPELLVRCAEAGNGRETAILRHLAEMGKTSYMISVLENGEGNGHMRKKFLQEFGQYPDPQIHQWVKREAMLESDFDVRALARQVLTATRLHDEV